MWTILSLVAKLIGIFFPDQSKEKVARDDGQTSGVSQQKAVDQAQTLKDVQDAKAASDAVDNAVAGGVPVSANDGFRRD